MNAATRFVDMIVSKIVSLAYVTIIVLGGTQVATRYVFSSSIVWVEELSKYLFVWLTFLAASAGVMSKAHISTTFLVDRLPPQLQRYAAVLADVLSLLFMALFTFLVTSLMRIAHTDISSTVGIPISYVYLGMFLGSLLMTVNLARLTGHDIQACRSDGSGESETGGSA